jgi:hypothetical protein
MTKHTCNDGYGPYFGRKTSGCPRCDELIAGDAPRRWAKDDRKAEYARFLRRLNAHDCNLSNCGPVCTAFDW